MSACLADPNETIWTVQSKFLQDPLYTRDYAKKFGTLYTAIYDVENLTVQLLWPNKQHTYSFEDFPEEKMQIRLDNLNINSKLAF
jgi:hypothetical protein